MNSTELIHILPQTITLNQMISLVTEIEAEVYDSPMYCDALSRLTKTSKQENPTADILKNFTKSVIRVAFQRFMTRPQFSEQPFELSNHAVTNDFPKAPTDNIPISTIYPTVEKPVIPVHEAETIVSQTVTENYKATNSEDSNNFVNEVKSFGGKFAHFIEYFNYSEKKLENYKNKLNNQKNIKKYRQKNIKNIGIKIRESRLAKSLTIRQISLKTAIVLSHVEAIENGWYEKLPEDIYLQGSIRRIGYAVGLDGDALAQEFMNLPLSFLPEPDIYEINKARLTNQLPKFYFTSTHLFFGYLTLIAGAIGMLSSMSNPADSHKYIPENESDRNEPPACNDSNSYAPNQTHELNSIDNTIVVQLNISPPELL